MRIKKHAFQKAIITITNTLQEKGCLATQDIFKLVHTIIIVIRGGLRPIFVQNKILFF